MGPIGIQEMMAIFVIALVLFGPKKLPELGRMLGKGLSEFRRAKSELKATFESHLSELEREAQAANVSTTAVATTNYSAPQYSYPYEDQGTWETGNSQEVVPAPIYGHSSPASESEAIPVSAEPSGSYATTPAFPVSGAVSRNAAASSEEHPA